MYKAKKFRYLGYTYTSVPGGWVSIVEDGVRAIDKLARPWWIPRFFLNFITKLSMGRSIVGINNIFIYKYIYYPIRRRYIKCQIQDIKDKYGGLRVYLYGSEEMSYIADGIEERSYRTCQECGSTNNVEQTDTNWILTLCRECRNK